MYTYCAGQAIYYSLRVHLIDTGLTCGLFAGVPRRVVDTYYVLFVRKIWLSPDCRDITRIVRNWLAAIRQQSFATDVFEHYLMLTRREQFQSGMDKVVPWDQPCALIEP